MKKTIIKQIGEVSVDSGTLLISDPCYIIGDDWNDKDYKKELVDTEWNLFKESIYDLGGQRLIVSTGFGDGRYPVFAVIKDYGEGYRDGKPIKNLLIKEIIIKFIKD